MLKSPDHIIADDQTKYGVEHFSSTRTTFLTTQPSRVHFTRSGLSLVRGGIVGTCGGHGRNTVHGVRREPVDAR